MKCSKLLFKWMTMLMKSPLLTILIWIPRQRNDLGGYWIMNKFKGLSISIYLISYHNFSFYLGIYNSILCFANICLLHLRCMSHNSFIYFEQIIPSHPFFLPNFMPLYVKFDANHVVLLDSPFSPFHFVRYDINVL